MWSTITCLVANYYKNFIKRLMNIQETWWDREDSGEVYKKFPSWYILFYSTEELPTLHNMLEIFWIHRCWVPSNVTANNRQHLQLAAIHNNWSYYLCINNRKHHEHFENSITLGQLFTNTGPSDDCAHVVKQYQWLKMLSKALSIPFNFCVLQSLSQERLLWTFTPGKMDLFQLNLW